MANNISSGSNCLYEAVVAVSERGLTLDWTTSSAMILIQSWPHPVLSSCLPTSRCWSRGAQAWGHEWIALNPPPLWEKELQAQAEGTPGQVMSPAHTKPCGSRWRGGWKPLYLKQSGRHKYSRSHSSLFLRTRERESKVGKQHNNH